MSCCKHLPRSRTKSPVSLARCLQHDTAGVAFYKPRIPVATLNSISEARQQWCSRASRLCDLMRSVFYDSWLADTYDSQGCSAHSSLKTEHTLILCSPAAVADFFVGMVGQLFFVPDQLAFQRIDGGVYGGFKGFAGLFIH